VDPSQLLLLVSAALQRCEQADKKIEKDSSFTPSLRNESEGIFKETGIPYEINLYGGVSHGFGVRANVSNRIERYAKETAYLQAVRWFDEWLK
jgi:dienelactone hydrolase